MQTCIYCKEPINGHTSFMVKVEFPLKSGDIEVRDLGLGCDKCVIDEGKPLIMAYPAKVHEGKDHTDFDYRCA